MNQLIEFPPGNVPMKTVARVYEANPNTIINRMESGMLNIGLVEVAKKKRGKRKYRNTYVSPLKLYNDTGFIWRGEKTVEELERRVAQ